MEGVVMAEKLLSKLETASRLSMTIRTFDRYKPKLIARGLQPVKIGGYLKYRESSLDKIISKTAETGEAIC